MYFENRAGDTANYLAQSVELDNYIVTVASVIDYVKAKKRSKKQVYISFDEWNVWYHSKEKDKALLAGNHGWPHAPALLEDIYNFEDVLQVGLILNTFIRRSDVVRIACIAQLVNVIAPIMTAPNGAAWRQSIFYPYYFASVFGRGAALNLAVNSPTYDAPVAEKVPFVDVAGVHDADGRTVTFFAVNRHLTDNITTEFSLAGFESAEILDHQVMTHADLRAVNTADKPDNVVPRKGDGASVKGDVVSVVLPPLSYQVIRLKV
jgi:alpha-N-arabinofuranosidase